MRSKKSYNERIENVLTELSQSLLRLSDDDIVAEVSAVSQDPTEEAKRVRNVLQKPLQILENANLCLANLGHSIDRSNWHCGPMAYHNTCVHCGLSVSIAIATAEIRGSAVQRACRANRLMIRQTGTIS